jgi:polar amino acid transport system substrate-binding protein
MKNASLALGILVLGLVVFAARAARADGLADLTARGKLLWGGDQEGGGPYVYPRDEAPDQVTGFEVDLAAAIADRLRVKAEFTQSAWDKLPEMLSTKKVDVILNGYELTPEREEVMAASMPYYAYALALLARKDDAAIASWDDLARSPNGHRARIGVLTGSAAETYAKEICKTDDASGSVCDVESYDGNTDTMREVETGKLDATLEDTPIASFYASRFPKLHPVGEPRRKGYYVAYVPKGDEALLRALNEALVDVAASGDLEKIDRAYGIWDERQQEIVDVAKSARFFGIKPRVSAEPGVKPSASSDGQGLGARKHGLEVARSYARILVQSAGLTVLLSVLSFPLAVMAGLLIAIGRLYGPAWVRAPLAAYVEFLRGTPVMLQLYFIFFFLPEVGINIPALACGVIGLAINYSAYESEIYRAGLQAVPRGQMEAALALGMPRWTAIRKIIVPQAVRVVIPPVVNDFIALFKDTSVCSVITLVELTKRFSVLSQSTQATIELMIMTALLYLAMSYPMSLVAQRIERSLGLEARV